MLKYWVKRVSLSYYTWIMIVRLIIDCFLCRLWWENLEAAARRGGKEAPAPWKKEREEGLYLNFCSLLLITHLVLTRHELMVHADLFFSVREGCRRGTWIRSWCCGYDGLWGISIYQKVMVRMIRLPVYITFIWCIPFELLCLAFELLWLYKIEGFVMESLCNLVCKLAGLAKEGVLWDCLILV